MTTQAHNLTELTDLTDLTAAALRVGTAFEMALIPHPALAGRLRAITNADDDREAAATAALILISAQGFISRPIPGSIPGSIPDIITATHPALPGILRTRWLQMAVHAQGSLRPLAEVAHRIIDFLPHDQRADRALAAAAATAEALGTSLHTDPAAGQDHPAGDALQHMPSDRQARGIFHTRQASAELLAHLALPDDVLELTGRPSVDRLRIADYSCGAGTLLTAAYRRVSQLHRTAGGDPAGLHQRLLRMGITGCDISPAAVAITAHNLARMQPHLPDVPQGIFTLEQGPANPGQPPRLGALDLLDDSSIKQPGLTRKRHGPRSQHAVLMNPPFTKPQQVPDPAVTRALYDLNSTLGARHNISLAYAFSMLAIRNVSRGGSIGLILPITAMEGAPPQQTLHPPKNINWQNLRNKLTSKFAGVIVVSIANYSEARSSFCHNSATADVMIAGRRLRRGEKKDAHATFVTLTRCPATSQEAEDLAAEIRLASRKHEDGQDCVLITLNGRNAGHSVRALTQIDKPWLLTRILDPQMIPAKSNLARGIIGVPDPEPEPQMTQKFRNIAVISSGKMSPANRIPVTTFSTLGRMHNAQPALGRQFGPVYELYTQDPDQMPVVNANSQPDQGRLLVVPTDAVHISMDQSKKASALIKRNASRLHLQSAFRFNTQASPVYLTQEPALGTGRLPSLVMYDPKYELATAAWLNTTPGLINLWSIAVLTHNGLARTAPSQIGAMPFLDLSALTASQLEVLSQVCLNLTAQTMLPTSEAWQDDAREELDRRVLGEILGMDSRSMQHLRSTRAKWCTEPTVQAKKGTSKSNKKTMTRLRNVSKRHSAATLAHQQRDDGETK